MTRTDRSSLPRARLLPGRTWLGTLASLAVFTPGALYVLAVNRWHVTAPVVMLLLCWAAVVSLGYHLARMAMSVNDTTELEAPVTGSRDELEREKRKLVKGIKEVEFDRECGKMSDADATALIATYRVRAMEILRELERLDADRADSPRARVEADLKARLDLEQKLASAGKAGRAKAGKTKKAAAAAATPDRAEAAEATEAADAGQAGQAGQASEAEPETAGAGAGDADGGAS
ncbi:MAG TPA: hypothetical protein VHE35_14200 [Kofleriaceae bacterium]|nr:hypothetical protein [Kofleriaceae bacterium]